jgi:hypothetical protein
MTRTRNPWPRLIRLKGRQKKYSVLREELTVYFAGLPLDTTQPGMVTPRWPFSLQANTVSTLRTSIVQLSPYTRGVCLALPISLSMPLSMPALPLTMAVTETTQLSPSNLSSSLSLLHQTRVLTRKAPATNPIVWDESLDCTHLEEHLRVSQISLLLKQVAKKDKAARMI